MIVLRNYQKTFILLGIVCLFVTCSTDLPRLSRYRENIWAAAEKLDVARRDLSEIIENRAAYPAYRAIQLAEDITSRIAFTQEELSNISTPDIVREGHLKLCEAAEVLAKASTEVETYAAAPYNMGARDRALMFLRSYNDLMEIATTRLEKAMESAGLVAHPPAQPIPKPGKQPLIDAYFRLE